LSLAGLRLDKAMLAGPMADAPASARLDLPTSGDGPRTEVSLIGSSVMLEMGRMTPDGKFQRPRLVIGNQSHELKAWMASMGVQAERCMLPTVRGRLKRSAEDGSIGAALLVSARCTFY
jgi:hypothetical protein